MGFCIYSNLIINACLWCWMYDCLLLVILLNNFVIFEERNVHNYNQNSQHLYQDPSSNLTNTSISIPLFIRVINLWKPPKGNILFWCQGFFLQFFHVTTLSIIHKRKAGKIKESSYISVTWLNIFFKYDNLNKNKIKSLKSGNFGLFFFTKILCTIHIRLYFLSPSEKKILVDITYMYFLTTRNCFFTSITIN
jgi:hypothetical protein